MLISGEIGLRLTRGGCVALLIKCRLSLTSGRCLVPPGGICLHGPRIPGLGVNDERMVHE
jgi:hypothetical protein